MSITSELKSALLKIRETVVSDSSIDKNGNGHRRTPASRRSFRLGRVVATPGVLQAVASDELLAGLDRHARCDWGQLSEEDSKENDFAVARRLRILSVYRAGGVKYWIITEADRSATTILLPSEY